MLLSDFVDYHRPALERDEVRHNLILALLARHQKEEDQHLRTWTLGGPGQCSIKTEGRNIVCGDLTKPQCQRLAEEVAKLGYPGIIGPDETAIWFADCARELGVRFLEPIRQQIHGLAERPTYPGSIGYSREVTADDAEIFVDWMTAFGKEAVPHDPAIPKERLLEIAGQGRHWFWIVNDEPVSMAAIARRTRRGAAINAVYTPPSHRRKGYAGSITACVVETIFAEGKKVACLYTDLSNPYSNRCYAKIGFKPVCRSNTVYRRPH